MNYYNKYFDVLLLTKNLNFNVSRDCSNSIWNFKSYSEVNNSYNNPNCNLPVVTNSQVSFVISNISNGTYQWACRGVNEFGYTKFSTNRTFSSGGNFGVTGFFSKITGNFFKLFSR